MPKRLHFHNPPAPDQKRASSELPSLRAVTENNSEPRHCGTENKPSNKTTHKIAHRIYLPLFLEKTTLSRDMVAQKTSLATKLCTELPKSVEQQRLLK